MCELTADALREMLDYDPDTGAFTWIKCACPRIKPGSVAGRPDRSGRRAINISGRKYASHRLAWLHVHGKWPESQIDHINRDPSDNRIENLRDVSASDNCRNRQGSGFRGRHAKGVSYLKRLGKWQAQICLPSQQLKYLGVFATEAEASFAYTQARAELL